MEIYKIQLIETVLVIIGYLIIYYINKGFVNNSLKQTHVNRGRRKMIIRAVHLLSLITAIVLLAAIWGVQQNDIAVFLGTILTVLGIAFFAQWSLLSNVTSSVLLFFNHPMKIGDTIKILDKEFPYEGEVSDLTYFFVHIRTIDKEVITIPNSLMLQKAILIVEQDHTSKPNQL
ncbi:mechanosensitive ion channel domain-containing protein [Pedobacter arcticus]|uniref:mechanosensitive ion channel domain-containing protein n=1 Tax=Pedobacter arcticus TaxID=752140 RepID=UPI00058C077B|nr:mechanosensitive ion channel family protein [Pedobacter arcticus]